MPLPKDKAGMIAAGYTYIQNKNCPCGSRMELWLTPEGATMPMNPMRAGQDYAESHFVTCPRAIQFRRKAVE